MHIKLTEKQWIEILLNKNLTKTIDISIFQTLYSFEGYQAYASQIGIILGYKGKAPHGVLNLEIGRYAKRIAKMYDIEFTKRSNKKYKFWDLFFNGWEEDKYFVWQLKKELVRALEATNLTGEIKLAEELSSDMGALTEGIKKTIIINAYERNPKARKKCIKKYGYNCFICGFNFQKNYGEIGKEFIHVHHLKPLSEIQKEYEVNPIEDLRPVCPNCHAMLHRKEPAYSIKEIQDILKGEVK